MVRLLTILMAPLVLASCAAHLQPDSRIAVGKSSAAGDELPKVKERLIVSTADIKIKTAKSDSLHNEVIDLTSKYDGYVLSSANDITTIRIPAANFKKAIKDIETLGEIMEKNISGQDVTEEYSDLQIRLENAIKTRDRYLALLEKANTLDDILTLEREMEKLNGKIELLEGKIEKMAHLVQYTSITIRTFREVRPGPVGYAFCQLYSGIKWLFVWN